MSDLLEISELRTVFDTAAGPAVAVDGVSFSIAAGETVGVVGESGCGKSVTALSVMRLVPSPPGRIAGGEIRFDGKNLLELDESGMREVRGNDIGMIFQEPMTSLNPVFTVGDQIGEALRLHRGLGKAAAREEAIRLLELVEIPSADRRVDDYPHQLSGGMRQRVMIAMALSCDPRLLIADEPTTALDVTIQAQILDLLGSLQDKFGMSLLMITHDLGVVAEYADRVVVMYAGRVIEEGTVDEVLGNPTHPYTRGLLASQPGAQGEDGRLATIPGVVPKLTELPPGCRFKDRCPVAIDACASTDPALTRVNASHRAACIVNAGAEGGGA